MVELLLDNILNIGDDEFYRAARYKLPLAVMLINSNDRNAFSVLEKSTRQSDIVQQLSSDMLIVFLSHTEYDKALLFVEKIEKELDFTYTISEFSGSEFDFIHDLFIENVQKHEKLAN